MAMATSNPSKVAGLPEGEGERQSKCTGSQSRPHPVAVKTYNIMQQAAETRQSFLVSQGSSLEPRSPPSHAMDTQTTLNPCHRATVRLDGGRTREPQGHGVMPPCHHCHHNFNLWCPVGNIFRTTRINFPETPRNFSRKLGR